MREASYLVLDLEQGRAGIQIADRLEPVLMPVAFLGDEAALLEKAMRSREVGDVNGDVVAIVGREWRRLFPEIQRLSRADGNACARFAIRRFRCNVEYLLVKP